MCFKKQNGRKNAENGDFQVVGSLLYAHYLIYFLLLLEKILPSSMLCENTSLNQQIWVLHISKY